MYDKSPDNEKHVILNEFNLRFTNERFFVFRNPDERKMRRKPLKLKLHQSNDCVSEGEH